MIKKFLKITLIFFLIPNCLFAKTEFFQEGITLYNKDKLEDATTHYLIDLFLFSNILSSARQRILLEKRPPYLLKIFSILEIFKISVPTPIIIC